MTPRPTPSAHDRMEALIAKIEEATAVTQNGRRIDIRSLDAESAALAKMLKGKPDETIKPLLARAVLAIERLTHALEDQVAALKDKKK